ncbi:MAG: hypothetical protein ACC649_01870 [Myxococcota bacterium]
MFDGAWIGEFIAGIVYLIVGVRLARLASRTGERPERLLSAMFFFSGISYLFYVVPEAIPIESLWTPFNFAGRASYIPAPILIALFTRAVFRSDGRFSSWMIYATAVLLVVGVGVSAMMGDWEGFSLANPFFWFEWVGYTIPFAWAGLEAFGQYRSSLRRQRLGLCDRLVCNRLLLWSIWGMAQVALSVLLLFMYAHFEATDTFSALHDGLTGVIEIFSLGLIWFVFFPPRYYRKLVSGSDDRESSVEGS